MKKKKSSRRLALRPLAQKLFTKRQLRRTLPVVGALAIVVAIIVTQMVLSSPDSKPLDTEAYKEQLRGQVTTPDGAPRDGRDPANQQQNSLASAANKPSGVGARTEKPAAGAIGSHNHHVSPEDVYDDPEQTGIGTNGCYIDYGIQGEQCLPTHAAMGGELTCEGVHSHGFPNGIKVTGTDRFHLDKNHDGIACGIGD